MKESADRDGECPRQLRTHAPRFDIRERCIPSGQTPKQRLELFSTPLLARIIGSSQIWRLYLDLQMMMQFEPSTAL